MGFLKILYFLDFPSGFGGAANTTIKQAELMKNSGMKVMVIIPLDGDGKVVIDFQNRCQALGLEYKFLKFCVTAVPEDINIIDVFEDYKSTENLIKEWKPNIVHSTQLNITVEMVCRKLRIPHIMNIYQIKDEFFAAKYVDVFPSFHICDSELYRQKWRKHVSLDSICIRNACKRVKINENSKYTGMVFICAGNFCERKNQLNIIKAFHLLIRDGIPAQMLFVGNSESEYARICGEFVEQNDLADVVQIKGFVPFAEYEIAKCSALICGSTIESFPNVIGEAMAAGVPVISTPVAGVPEVLSDGENAYLTKGYGTEDIYEAMKRFFFERNTEKQKKIIENAYQTYQNEFSAETVTQKLQNYYQYVLTKSATSEISKFQVEQLWEKYGPYIKLFKENEHKFKRAQMMKRIIWLIPSMKEKMEKNSHKELVIWGAGTYGAEAKVLVDIFFPEWKLLFFLDNNKTGDYLGVRIARPERQYWENDIVWIANVAGQNEIIERLEVAGKAYQKDFFIVAPRIW